MCVWLNFIPPRATLRRAVQGILDVMADANAEVRKK